MEMIIENLSYYIIRLDYGEELREKLESFCREHDISAGWFNAFGACKDFEIGYYNLRDKKYETKIFNEDLEAASIIGNISILGGKPYMHAHGTFSRPSMEVIGGHIMKCTISGTLEIKLEKPDGIINRKLDDFTGLNLMCK